MFDGHLQESGAILLRGLPITSGDACEAFVSGLGYSLQAYEPYGGVRQKVCVPSTAPTGVAVDARALAGALRGSSC